MNIKILACPLEFPNHKTNTFPKENSSFFVSTEQFFQMTKGGKLKRLEQLLKGETALSKNHVFKLWADLPVYNEFKIPPQFCYQNKIGGVKDRIYVEYKAYASHWNTEDREYSMFHTILSLTPQESIEAYLAYLHHDQFSRVTLSATIWVGIPSINHFTSKDGLIFRSEDYGSFNNWVKAVEQKLSKLID